MWVLNQLVSNFFSRCREKSYYRVLNLTAYKCNGVSLLRIGSQPEDRSRRSSKEVWLLNAHRGCSKSKACPEHSLQQAGLAFPAPRAALWGGEQPHRVLPLLKQPAWEAAQHRVYVCCFQYLKSWMWITVALIKHKTKSYIYRH